MIRLFVEIEKNGEEQLVGEITGRNSDDARFTYADNYLSNTESRPISISLPLKEKEFNAKRTRNFFEGLLPEGFTRRCVAEWMHVDENDYLSLLSGLGNECLGAIKIIGNGSDEIESKYRRLSDLEVKKLAQEGTTESAELVTKSHLSLTGASGKVGLYYHEEAGQWFLPLGEAPSTHIVKQSHIRLKKIVANEQLCLLTAQNLGIEIPDSFIVKTDGDDEEDILFATKRYDRKLDPDNKTLNGLVVPYRLHQEDFAQALGIPSSAKYEKNQDRYLERIFDTIKSYSVNPISDQLKLWDICIFNYLIGNTDNHIKNLSLLYSEDLKKIRLAPAYDIISTMIYESSTEMMALSIGGKYHIDDITRKDFEMEAASIGLGRKIAMERFDAMVMGLEQAMNKARENLHTQGFAQIDEVCSQILEKGGIKQYR